MLVVISALRGYAIEATDGRIGVISDVLFDDQTWHISWLVVDTGSWLSSRKILIHPSSIGKIDDEHEELPVTLTTAQVEASPAFAEDQPVSRQMQSSLYGYYGYDPLWGGSGASPPDMTMVEDDPDHGDPHLRSIAAVRGYHMHGTDGLIGHLENILVEDQSWAIHYFIVDTRNWWPGKHVLLSPCAVTEISWADREIWINVTRAAVETSPPWKPLDMIDQVYDRQIRRHYGWPGY